MAAIPRFVVPFTLNDRPTQVRREVRPFRPAKKRTGPPRTERDGRTANRMSPEHRLIHARLEKWARGANSPGARAEAPEGVANTDAAVNSLPRREREAIRRYYRNLEPVEVQASALHMHPRELMRILRDGREYLAWTLQQWSSGGSATLRA